MYSCRDATGDLSKEISECMLTLNSASIHIQVDARLEWQLSAMTVISRCCLFFSSPGRDERPVFLVLCCPKLQPALSGSGSALLPAAGPELRYKVRLIWNGPVCSLWSAVVAALFWNHRDWKQGNINQGKARAVQGSVCLLTLRVTSQTIQ